MTPSFPASWDDVAYRIEWTLVHSIWQCAAVAAVLTLVLLTLRRASPTWRYAIACSALLCAVGVTVFTFVIVHGLEESPIAFPEDARPVTIPSVVGDNQDVIPQLALVVKVEPGSVDADQTRTGVNDHAIEPVERPGGRQPARVESRISRTVGRISQALSERAGWVAVAWMIGVCCLSLWHIGGWFALMKLRRLGIGPADRTVRLRFEQLREQAQVNGEIQLWESAIVEVPVVIGWLRPVVLIPACMIVLLDWRWQWSARTSGAIR